MYSITRGTKYFFLIFINRFKKKLNDKSFTLMTLHVVADFVLNKGICLLATDRSTYILLRTHIHTHIQFSTKIITNAFSQIKMKMRRGVLTLLVMLGILQIGLAQNLVGKYNVLRSVHTLCVNICICVVENNQKR